MFPQEPRKQVILVSIPNGDSTVPKARPICLLNEAGFFEKTLWLGA